MGGGVHIRQAHLELREDEAVTIGFNRKVDLEDDAPKNTVITSPRKKYEVEGWITSGDLADIFKAGDAALKVSRKQVDNDLLENEAQALLHLVKGATEAQKRYLPQLVDSFQLVGDKTKHVNAFSWLTDFYTFEQIRIAHPDGLRFEHGVWMLNRILEGLDFLHLSKVLHGAVLPPHLMVFASANNKDPMTHGVKLIDFTASVPLGGSNRIKVVSPQWKTFYPTEVFDKKNATPGMDIFMAVKSIIFLLGGNPETNLLPSTVPNYLIQFLRGCVEPKKESLRPKDAWELHEELEGLMIRNFGPKKYIHFEMPAKPA
jgi:hypothetical protein